MKKLIALLMVLTLMLSLAACGGNSDSTPTENKQQTETSAETAPTSESTEKATEKPEPETEPVKKDLGTFNKNVTLDETVMVDENGVKITATGLTYNNYEVELELTIENNSDRDLSFIAGSVGYCCNSINGYMTDGGYLNCDVASGKKANESIGFSYDSLMIYGINEIADMEIGFEISDEDYNSTYLEPRQIKTSAFESHDYTKDYYQETIAGSAAMSVGEYDMPHFSQDPQYDANGIKMLSSGIMVREDGESYVLLELENTTDKLVYVTASDLAVNGLVLNTGSVSSDAINPGKRCIADVELSNALPREYWEIYGITEVGSVALTLGQHDSDRNDLADDALIEITDPDVKAEFDASGSEVYNNGGIRIAAKTLMDDSSEYSHDMYVFLLAENKSGKTVTIRDEFDSLSVNGFMTDYSMYKQELEDGESGIIVVKLWVSSLEENKVTSASDVKEVEMEIEIIGDAGNKEKAVLTMPFNQ